MKTSKLFFCLIVFLINQSIYGQYSVKSPEWTKDLIIYEISPKNFTSPHGPETGTFNSTKEKIAYLKDLGINAVWLAGHNWADHKHFYNVWTQYATIRPDSIEPSLGTPEDFKSLIKEFHNNDIKVFLDIITHGVVSSSPLLKEKPHWFKGGSWEMSDYDWYGKHEDLDDWWVESHTRYVTEFGVDGFRLDVDIYRPDLWYKIKQNALQAGHPIVVFSENDRFTDGISDFFQVISRLSDNKFLVDRKNALLRDVASYYRRFIEEWHKVSIQRINVTYADDSVDFINADTQEGKLSFNSEKVNTSDIRITIKNIDKNKTIKKIEVIPHKYRNLPYTIGGNKTFKSFPILLTNTSEISVVISPDAPDTAYQTNQISAHDRGREGFILNENPYVVQGSRCIMGYSGIFTPAIPFFMSGEEFESDFVPVPTLSPYLYKKEKVGEGTWLYGNWIQWDQLRQKKNQEMLADVKKMIAIRKQEKDLIRSQLNDVRMNLDPVEFEAAADIPVPYIMWNENKALLVAGNDQTKDMKVKVVLPLDKIGMANVSKIKITDLWNGGSKILDVEKSADYTFNIKRDKVAGGGVSIFKLEAAK